MKKILLTLCQLQKISCRGKRAKSYKPVLRVSLTKVGCFFGLALLTVTANANQQKDIESIIRELDYLIETTQQLQKKYHKDRSQVRFNYQALLAQLTTARNRAQEYLNQELLELHSAPPATVVNSLTEVR